MTVRRLRRLAASLGCWKSTAADWHDLAMIRWPPTEPSRRCLRATRHQPAWGADTGGRQIDAAQLLGIIEAIRKSGAWLSANAREFLNGLECKATAYPSVTLSERQHQWLVDLATQAAAERSEPMRLEAGHAIRSSAAGTPLDLRGVRRRPRAPRSRRRSATRRDLPGTPAPQIRAPGGATRRPSR